MFYHIPETSEEHKGPLSKWKQNRFELSANQNERLRVERNTEDRQKLAARFEQRCPSIITQSGFITAEILLGSELEIRSFLTYENNINSNDEIKLLHEHLNKLIKLSVIM